MCECESCQLLMDTYNEFLQKRNAEKEKEPKVVMPPPAKTAKNERNHGTIIAAERTKCCQKCGMDFNSHEQYRDHVKEKHPIYWKHIALESVFQEKRKLVVRNNKCLDIKSQKPSSSGIFFRRELERSNQLLTTNEVTVSSHSTVFNQSSVPSNAAVFANNPVTATLPDQSTAAPNQPSTKSQQQTPDVPTSTKNEKAPMTFFYPMMYPVYFVMDKNQPPGTLPTMVGAPPGHQQGIPIPQMPQVGSMPPPGPVMFPPQMMMSGGHHSVNIARVHQPGNIAGTKKEKIVCGECGLIFKFKEELILHMGTHSQKPSRCEQCDLTFVNNVELKRHYRTHGPLTCPICEEIFTTRDKLIAHKATKHSTACAAKSLSCRTCQMSFSNNVELKRHYRTHAFFKCKNCSETFVSWEQLVQHNNAKHIAKTDDLPANDVKYLCSVCKQMFTTCEIMQAHTCLAQRSCDLRCKRCGQDFENHQELTEHMKEHKSTSEMFMCYHCNMSFPTGDKLAKHLKFHKVKKENLGETSQQKSEGELIPEVAQQSIVPDELIQADNDAVVIREEDIKKEPIDYNLVDEELEEDNESPTRNKHYACSKCGALFSRMFSLNRHYKIHTGERGYKCSVCGASFRTQSQQKTHMLTHTGERPFKCHICPATFIQQGNLKRHIWTHTGTKPHVCSVCQSGFLSTSDLKRHFRTHTGEKPYKCQLCQCSFTTSGNLKSHLKTHPHGVSNTNHSIS